MRTLLVLFLSALAWATPCVVDTNALCVDPTCGQSIALPDPCPCGPEHVGYTFTPCDTATNTRKVLYYWRPPAICTANNFSLPQPLGPIPCDLSCPAGQHLNAETLQCEECKAGSYSIGGGQRWDTWTGWPSQLINKCVGTSTSVWTPNPVTSCDAWRLLGNFIDSGSNPGVNRITSTLSYNANFARNGTVRFTYRVSSEEGWDGLLFSVDSARRLWATGFLNWTTVSYEITAGYHLLTWEYVKDVSLERGEDRALISSIVISGTSLADLSCSSCPPGKAQGLDAQGSCSVCPEGTFSTGGATACTPCPSGQSSFEGASECFVPRNCSSADQTARITACTNGHKDIISEWISPPSCDTAHGTLNPSSLNVPCETICNPGQYLSTDSQTCTYCQDGSVTTSATKASRCEICPLKTQQNARIAYISSFPASFTLPAGFSTGCTGHCATSGWRPAYSFIDSGSYHGPGTEAWLSYTVNLDQAGIFEFSYTALCDTDATLTFSIRDQTQVSLPCGGCNASPRSLLFNLSPGAHTFRWSYRTGSRLADQSSLCDAFRVSNISVTGVSSGLGGSTACLHCPAGTWASAVGRCSRCPVGTYSGVAATNCSKCPAGTYSLGAAQCSPCGMGTTNAPGSSTCSFNCSVLPLSSFYNTTASAVFSLDWVPSNGASTPDGRVNIVPCSSSGYLTAVITDPEDNSNITYTADFVSFSPNVKSPKDGFLATYSRSESNQCIGTVRFLCDPLEQLGVGSLSYDSSLVCGQTAVVWRSRLACRKCAIADYRAEDSECVNSKKTTTFYWVTDMCNGGVTLPEPVTSSCTSPEQQAEYKKWAVVGGCVAALALVVGGIIIGVLFWHNRRIYKKYKQLAVTDAPMQSVSDS